jgi:hypothetical protein
VRKANEHKQPGKAEQDAEYPDEISHRKASSKTPVNHHRHFHILVEQISLDDGYVHGS